MCTNIIQLQSLKSICITYIEIPGPSSFNLANGRADWNFYEAYLHCIDSKFGLQGIEIGVEWYLSNFVTRVAPIYVKIERHLLLDRKITDITTNNRSSSKVLSIFK